MTSFLKLGFYFSFKQANFEELRHQRESYLAVARKLVLQIEHEV